MSTTTSIDTQIENYMQSHGYDNCGFCGILEGGEFSVFIKSRKNRERSVIIAPACFIIKGESITFYEGDEARQLLRKHKITPSSILF